MKVGSYEIPEYRLFPAMVDATKIIFDKFRGESAPDNLTVATLWGHKSVSGTVLTKLGALRSYGLIEKRGIKVTELGKNITYPTNDDEKNEAIKQAILNIPLWAELYRKFGVTLPKENFWVDLRQITGLEAPDSQKHADVVRNAYMDDVKYLLPVKVPAAKPDPQNDEPGKESDKEPVGARDRRPKVETTESTGFVHVKYPGCCDAIIDLQDAGSLTVIDSLLNAIRAKIAPETKKENPISDDTVRTS